MIKKYSILDVFTKISNEHEAVKPDLCIRLWNHLKKNCEKSIDEDGNETEYSNEVTYTLRRLVQGLGSNRAPVRKCYFATLISILSYCEDTFGAVSLTYFKSIIDKQFSKFETKGEEGEVLTGTILAYGVAFKSNVFLNADVELQQKILSDMLKKSKDRSYLPLLAFTFLMDFINSVDESVFQKVVWPVLANEILIEWRMQSFETLHCLIEVQNKYPTILKQKIILSKLQTPTILHKETIENVFNMLTSVTREPRLKHPLYDCVGRCLAKEENSELMSLFWSYTNNLITSSPTRLQQLAVFAIFCSIAQHIDTEQMGTLLTSDFVDMIINCCKSTSSKSDKLLIKAKESLQLIISRATQKQDAISPALVYKILCKLTFDAGYLLIDKLTGVKVVFPCVSKLDSKYVKLLSKKCGNVILLNKKKCNKSYVNREWNFKDRSYASQLLARLISHSESQDMDWKIKHLKFLLKYAIFFPHDEEGVRISNELSSVLKNSFSTALSHQLSHLENHRMVLISLVYYIDNMLTNDGFQLRVPLTEEAFSRWKETMSKIQKIDLKINKTIKRKTVMLVFHTLFLQMALHLFIDVEVAKDILIELDRCYKKEKVEFEKMKNDKEGVDESEPKWIEIAVELFLSLLSRDTFLLRQLISRIFPHLCPFLTAQATFQILQVLDPSVSSNILTDGMEDSDEENSTDDDESSVNENDAMEGDVEDESDSEVEDEDNAEESAIEKTRQAVRDALGVAGSVTDTESVDLDDIDEEEGKKLDVALSEAFKSAQKAQNNKNKKQSPTDKALTNFRIRVLDLVDIYLENDPSLSLVLDTIPNLFTLLEFCVKSPHQKPLENRIRATLKNIGNIKKCSNCEDIDVQLLADVLKKLMDKGVRSTPLFLDLCTELSECCTFLLKMGIQEYCKKSRKKDVLFETFSTAINNFFLKRDCLLPISLFENILLKVNWLKNAKLCERIVSFTFDSSVRGFRRNQGLSLLCCFYKNTRLLSIYKEENDADFMKLEDTILQSAVAVLLSLKVEKVPKVKPSFLVELFLLLCTIKSSKFSTNSGKWTEMSNTLQSFLNNGSSALNVSKKYVTKLCVLLQIPFNKLNNSRKRKRKEELVGLNKISKNGYTSDHVSRQSDRSADSDQASSEDMNTTSAINNGNIVSDKTVIKKKKSKRRTKEHYNSKILRNKLANEVDVFTFSKANVMETL